MPMALRRIVMPPEIEQEVAKAAGLDDVRVNFTPHLVPMNRGEYVSIYARRWRQAADEKRFGKISMPTSRLCGWSMMCRRRGMCAALITAYCRPLTTALTDGLFCSQPWIIW